VVRAEPFGDQAGQMVGILRFALRHHLISISNPPARQWPDGACTRRMDSYSPENCRKRMGPILAGIHGFLLCSGFGTVMESEKTNPYLLLWTSRGSILPGISEETLNFAPWRRPLASAPRFVILSAYCTCVEVSGGTAMKRTGGARSAWPGQTTWVPATWAPTILCWAAVAGGVTPACADEALSVSGEQSTVSANWGGRTLAVYRFAENPAKPYLQQLFSPSGTNVLLDSPSDHKHHHGLMFAVAVDGVDFWSENATCGRQLFRGGEEPKVVTRHGVEWASGTERLDWVAPGTAKTLLRETRRISIGHFSQPDATLVAWICRLEPPADKKSVTLTGANYFGLGMRFVRSMDAAGPFVNANGKTGVEGTNAARSAWCAYSASAEGKPVTVAVFDDPKNPRHPATWFTMDKPFAYVSATLDLSRQPLVIESGKPLELRYAVAVWDGKVEVRTIAEAYRRLTASQ
jgi:hypothetical protein